MGDDPVPRRRALQFGGLLLAGSLAGCQTGDDTPTGDESGPTDEPIDPTATGGGGDTDAPPDGTTRSGTATSRGTDPGGRDGETDATGDTDTPGDAETIAARRVASGFTSPLGLEIPEPGRQFVVDQVGQIHLVDEGDLLEEPFLDVSDSLVELRPGLDERGLLGLAFHPDYSDNGRFFVRYSAPPRDGTPSDYDHTFVLSEFHAEPGSNRADPDSERTILEIPEPQFNHNAGAIAFGPDGYLYVAVGDGGAADDQGLGHVEDWYDAVGGGNGQDVTENLLGSILRIDVDSEPSSTDRDGGGTADGRGSARNYAIPDDNPLVGQDGMDEHYAWGFRNPWRMTFGPEGRLFVGDVGQNAWEEVDVVESGGNYGWNVYEGTHCFQAEDCPSESARGTELRDPVIEYPHEGQPVSGVSVICGYLYDGSDMPALDGQFVFADWRMDGELFVARERDDGLWPTRRVAVESDARFGPSVLSFGRNPDGELFVCTSAGGLQGESGAVFRLGASA